MLDNWSYMSAAELQDMNSKGITGCQGWSSWSANSDLATAVFIKSASSPFPLARISCLVMLQADPNSTLA